MQTRGEWSYHITPHEAEEFRKAYWHDNRISLVPTAVYSGCTLKEWIGKVTLLGMSLNGISNSVRDRIHASYALRHTNCQQACLLFMQNTCFPTDISRLIARQYVWPSKFDRVWLVGSESTTTLKSSKKQHY